MGGVLGDPAKPVMSQACQGKIENVWKTDKSMDETGVIVQLKDGAESIACLDDLETPDVTDGQCTDGEGDGCGKHAGPPVTKRRCAKGCGWTGVLTKLEPIVKSFDMIQEDANGIMSDKAEAANGFIFFVLDDNMGKTYGQMGQKYAESFLDPPHLRQRCFYPNQATKEHPATGSCNMLVAYNAAGLVKAAMDTKQWNQKPFSIQNDAIKTWQHEGGKWTKELNNPASTAKLPSLLTGKHSVIASPDMIYHGQSVFGAPCQGVSEASLLIGSWARNRATIAEERDALVRLCKDAGRGGAGQGIVRTQAYLALAHSYDAKHGHPLQVEVDTTNEEWGRV